MKKQPLPYRAIRIARTRNTNTTKCCQGCRAPGTLWSLAEIQRGAATSENRQLLAKLNKHLPCNPAIILLSIYPKELKTFVHTKTCTQMFLAALFAIAKNMEATKVAFNKWTDKLWYTQTKTILFSDKNKWALKPWKTRRNFKCTMPSNGGQSGKVTYCMIPTIWQSGKGKAMESVGRSLAFRGGSGRRTGGVQGLVQ